MAADGKETAASEFDGLLGYHLRRAWVRNMADFTGVLGDEIKPVPFTVVCVIAEAPGITAAEIARRLQMQRANLAPMLADIEGRGLIERRPDREDHRVQRLHLSAAGNAALNEWQARVAVQEETTFGVLTAEEQETLKKMLTRIWSR